MASFKQPAPFSIGSNPAEDWEIWRKRFLIFFGAAELSQKRERNQRDILLHIIGEKGLEIWENLDTPEPETDKVNAILDTITEHFKPYRNTTIKRHEFAIAVQQESSSIDQFVADLTNKAKVCEFGDLTESLIRDRLICGLREVTLKERLLREGDLPLAKAIEMCRAHEISKSQSQEINSLGEKQINVINKYTGVRRTEKNYERGQGAEKKKFYGKEKQNVSQKKFKCTRCLTQHQVRECPAYGKKCRKCNGQNHFAVACRARENAYKKHVGAIEDEQDEESEGEFFISTIQSQVNEKDWLEKIKLNNIEICEFKLDTGSQVNVLPYKIYLKLKKKPKLKLTKRKATSYSGHILNIKGYIDLNCKTKKGIQGNYEFLVVETPFQPILGLKTCKQLNLIERINAIGTIKKPEEIINEYKEVFQGLGRLPGKYHIKIKDDVKPIISVPRRLPFTLQSKVKRELGEMLKSKIIQKVEKPSNWVHPTVIQNKPGGGIRICLDPRKSNEAILREHVQLPTLEDILGYLKESTIFTVLDAAKAFHQLVLDEQSSDLCTFATPYGRFKYNRMPFGIKSAPEVFQKAINNVIQEIPGVFTYFDDVLITGKNMSEHNERLEKVLKRAKDNNLKFDKTKLQLAKSKVKYLGHYMGKEGLEIIPDRARGIKKLNAPKDKPALQRFLGMIGYITRFIPHLATKTEYLRQLIKKGVKWSWDKKAQEDFEHIKQQVIKAPVLPYFDQNKPVTITADASLYGLGAALMQGERPIAFASATLTETQRNYPQIDKEMLAIVFGCEKFHRYIYGKQCTIETDHKPLVSIIKKPIEKISPRLQRMVVRLQRYDIDLKYVAGKLQVISDTLSRDPEEVTIDTNFLDKEMEAVHTIVSATPEKIEELQRATNTDPTMQILKNYCNNGWPNKIQQVKPELRRYWTFKEDLYTSGELIFRGNQIVIPREARPMILRKLHQSHIGIVQCKNRARGAVFWDGMSKDIEIFINQCKICQKHAKEQRKEPLQPHEITNRPWEKLGIDFMKVKGIEYILAIDYHSKYIEVKPLKRTTADPVIEFIKEICSRFGIPNIIMTDNGPPFNSINFSIALREWDIKHITSSPRYSQSNGMVERNIQTCKTRLKKTAEAKEDFYTVLLNYRATPHDGLKSPAELLMGRRIRTQLPVTEENLKPYYEVEETLNRLKINQEKQKQYADRGARELKQLKVGESVLYKHSEKDWREGTVKKQEQPRSYIVDDPEGGVYRRNRRHIREWKTQETQEETIKNKEETVGMKESSPESKEEKCITREEEVVNKFTKGEKEKIFTRRGREVLKPKRYRED